MAVLALLACKERNPAYCEATEDCRNGQVCDLEVNICMTDVDGGTDGSGCTLDDDCDSGVCEGGSCLSPEQVLYASSDGRAAGACLPEDPCELLFALSQVTPTKHRIRLSNGTYDLATDVVVDAPIAAVTLVGSRNAVLRRSLPGAVVHVQEQSTLQIRGLTLNKGVSCFGASLELVRAVSDNAPAEALPLVDLQNCVASIVASQLNDAPADAVVAGNGGTLAVEDSAIIGSAGNGITSGLQHRLVVRRTEISGSNKIGLDATGTHVTVERSKLFQNRLGGVRAVNGSATVVEITNNFIYRNGRDPDSNFGGVLLDTNQSGNRIIHNTIVWNDMNPSSMYAGGLYCKGSGTFTNNLIFHNFAGNVSQPNAQFVGTCQVTTSTNSIGYGTGSNDMHFVSETSIPFDYHLADRQSPAVDRGVAGQVMDDYDGENRGDFPDMGADELP